MDPFRVLALFVLAFLVWYSLKRYHDHRSHALWLEHVELEGWQTVTLGVRQEVWLCPHCGSLIPDRARVEIHQLALSSACAAFIEQQEQREQAEALAEAQRVAEQAGRINTVTVSATVGGEVFTNDGPELIAEIGE